MAHGVPVPGADGRLDLARSPNGEWLDEKELTAPRRRVTDERMRGFSFSFATDIRLHLPRCRNGAHRRRSGGVDKGHQHFSVEAGSFGCKSGDNRPSLEEAPQV